MKICIVLVLLFLSWESLASPGSFPREAFILWAGYRIEQEVSAPNPGTIAPGCKPTNTKYTFCTMAEFLKHICKNPPSPKSTLNDQPDLNQAIKWIKREKFADLKYDINKLLPNSNKVAHGEVMSEVADVIQKSASILYAKGFNHPEIDKLLKEADSAREFAHTVRNQEHSRAKVTELQKQLGPLFQSKTFVEDIGGGDPKRKYQDIDVSKALSKATTPSDKQLISKVASDYATAQLGSPKDKRHEETLIEYRGNIKTKIMAAKACVPVGKGK